MNVLAEPIRREFGLTDLQIGLLTGLAFAVLNVGLGLWVARLAERMRRLTFVAIGTFLWSVATAACGIAGTFGQLALARISVGVGEAVGLPASQSLVADCFPPERRTSAMAVLQLAPPLGAFIGSAGGAMIAEAAGWRTAFLLTAAPGFVLALAVHLLLEEPPRGRFDGATAGVAVPSLGEVLRRMWRQRGLRGVIAASTIASLVGFGVNVFLAALLARRFGFGIGPAGVTAGLIASIPATVSVLCGGWIADRLGSARPRFYALVPGWSLLAAAPLYALAVTRGTPGWSIGLLAAAAVVQYSYLGPTYGVLQNLMQPRMRVSAAAVSAVFVSVVGAGLGPLCVGALSDHLAPHPGAHGNLPAALALMAIGYAVAGLLYLRVAGDLEADFAAASAERGG